MEDRSLRLDGVTLEDIGEYSCEADNAVGSVTASGMLFVQCECYQFICIYLIFVVIETDQYTT